MNILRAVIVFALATSALASGNLQIPSANVERVFRFSQATLIAATTYDITRSYGQPERNPLLRGPDGRLGNRGAVISAGITVGWLVASELMARRWPWMRKRLAWMNFGAAGLHFAAPHLQGVAR